MGFYLNFSMLFFWVVGVLIANFFTDSFIEFLKRRLEMFYEFCWQRRAGKFGEYFMLFFDKFLTKSYQTFGYTFMPVWLIICFFIFSVILLIIHVLWVRMLFVVANTWPQHFMWLLVGPMKDAWF
jgi:hypothetical protein